MSKILLITGPSGIGKTFLGQQLLAKYPAAFKLGKLFTTRAVRPNEEGGDRISVSSDEFKAMSKLDDFFTFASFHNNFYGYPRTLFTSTRKNVIINTWPALVPKFIDLPNICIVALVSPAERLSALTDRMSARGDSPKIIAERLPLIQRDQDTLLELKPLILKTGRLFTIQGEGTIPDEVIPWVENHLKLEA